MTSIHLHLMTAHLPVIGVPFAGGLLVAGVVGKSDVLWRTGCWMLLISTVFAAFPYFSGPAAYEVLSERYGIASEPVERHAVVARAASLGLVLLGAVTLSALLRDGQGEPPGKPLKAVILVGVVVIIYALAWSAHLGGSIRHPELVDAPLWVFPTLED